MEKSFTFVDDSCNAVLVLAQALSWAHATIPIGDLPHWVFCAEIALQQMEGRVVEKGSCRSAPDALYYSN